MKDIAIERWILPGMLSLLVVVAGSAQERLDSTGWEDRILSVAEQLNSDVRSDPGLAALYAEMLGERYGTPQREIVWALDHDLSWGEIAILSYEQATTGTSFEQLAAVGAHTNAMEFATRMEMSHDKMTESLEEFAAQAVEMRNTRIFDRLRVNRRVSTLPDLGAGFGLFQEALDLRQLGPPDPIKDHGGSGFAKGGGEDQ